MGKKRKHVRVPYEQSVELFADGHSLTARSIDISNSGIQVEINIPSNGALVQRISFPLPLDSDTIDIPCKIARTGPNGKGQILGIEFSYQSESQMLLVENFIKNAMCGRISNEQTSSEMRIIPRVSCRLTHVTIDRPDVTITSIDDISADGCLVSHTGTLEPDEDVRIEFFFPGDDRKISLFCKVTHAARNSFREANRAGLSFNAMTEIEAARVRNFIIQAASSTAMREIHERRGEIAVSHEYRIEDKLRISGLLESLRDSDERINALFENSIYMHELKMIKISGGRKMFITSPLEQGGGLDLQKSDPAYFSFFMEGSSYYFTARLNSCGEAGLAFDFPSVVYQSEKRSDKRKSLQEGIDISINLGSAKHDPLWGKLINISRRGFLCYVVLRPADRDLIKPGLSVSYSLGKDLGLDAFGEIRHIKETLADNDRIAVEIGVETGIQRADYTFRRFSSSRWEREKLSKKQPKSGNKKGLVSEPVVYQDSCGRELVALINCTRERVESPVVILPPAFGKKKETLSPLVATLMENFSKAGKDIAIIRYDGINRPGESYNDDMCSKRGYEMLHYRISQGMSDLEATVNFACDNPFFKPTSIIIVAFSMSALDTRKLALKDERISYLINVMGVTCARSSFMSTTGGLDIIGNARMGIKNGLSGVLGHILDLDVVAQDLIANKYAYLADARHDMAQITTPVSWIYGKYDKWIPAREIYDIMSVKTAARREVFEIPTGHNLRSSEDAIKTFKIITGLIYRHLHGKDLRLIDPDRDAMVDLITCERERLARREEVDFKSYWKDYLLGREIEGKGYDSYMKMDEFREFFSLQSSLIDLKNGEVMADMGCGTGIFMEKMLEDTAGRGINISDARLVLIDLVEEGLTKAREKLERLERERGFLMPQSVGFIQMNLQPDQSKEAGDNERYQRLKLEDRDFAGLDVDSRKISWRLGLRNCCFDKICASLLISYLTNPDEILREFHRLLKPGGRLLVSSMKPDSDISVIFTNYISKLRTLALDEKENSTRETDLAIARVMLNEAAELFELEEDGYFRFFSGDELKQMMEHAGFDKIQIRHSLGDPPQAAIATGVKKA